jgi:hypothetical protein
MNVISSAMNHLHQALPHVVAAFLSLCHTYPTASQVKHILMDSSLQCTIEVTTLTKEDENNTLS